MLVHLVAVTHFLNTQKAKSTVLSPVIEKNVSYNKVESVVPKLSSFVSADDRFASLLGSTKRLPSSVKISPVVIPRQHVNSAENKDTHATNGSLRNYSTEAKTNGHEMHLETSTVIQESKQVNEVGPPCNFILTTYMIVNTKCISLSMLLVIIHVIIIMIHIISRMLSLKKLAQSAYTL